MKEDQIFNEVPCGRCFECLAARQNSWFVRLLSEYENSTSAKFVTLTYDDMSLPWTEDNCYPTLQYEDVQKFFKRLRKNNKSQIKYYVTGEYGEKDHRPHYHAIIFNVENWAHVDHHWCHGMVHFGDVNEKTIYYTLKYINKNLYNPRIKDRDEMDTRKPEKALMSKGLGLSYLTPQMIDYLTADPSRCLTLKGGQKVALPRYYKHKLFQDQEQFEQYQYERSLALANFLEERKEKMQDPKFVERVLNVNRVKEKKLKQTN